MTGGGLIQLLTVGVEDAPLILNPEITFFKTVYRKHTNFSMEQIVKNIGTKKFDCFHQFKIEKVTDLLSGLHFIIDIPYFNVLKTVTSKIIENPDIININELSIMYSDIKTYLFFEKTSNKYYLIPETFFNLSEIDNFTNSVDSVELQQNLLNNLFIQNIPYQVNILQLKNSTLNQLLSVIRLNFDNWTEFWLKIINKKENFNYFTRLLSQLSLIDDFNKRLNLIIYDKFNNYNIYYDYKEYLNFSDEIKNYYLLENNKIENPIFDSDYAINYAIKNNLDIDKCKLETIKFNSLFFLFLLQTIYPDFTTNIKSFTFWKKYNLYENNSINNELPVTTNNYFLEWSKRFNFYQETSYGIEYDKLNIEIYNIFFKKYNECESNINLEFNTIDIKEKEKLWCILYTIYLRFNNKDINKPLNKICFDDYFNQIPYFNNETSFQIEDEIIQNLVKYKSLIKENLVKDNLSNFDKYDYIQPVDLALLYVYLCYNYLETIANDNIFLDYHFLVLWRNKINIAYFFRTADILDNYNLDNIKNNSLKNVFNLLHDYNETNKLLTFYHNIDLTREINLDIIRDELIKTIYSESFFGTVDIETNNLDVNEITISPYQDNSSNYDIKNQTIEISEDLTVNFTIENAKIIINNWNRNSFNQLFIKNNGSYVEMSNFEITDNIVYIKNQNLNLHNLSTIDIRTINKFKIPIVNIKDISNNSLSNTFCASNRILLYNNSTINNINNKQIFYDIEYDINYFYQLDIRYIDNSIERINVDFYNNYFISELDLQFNKIKTINLDIINLNLKLIGDVSNNNIYVDNLNRIISFKASVYETLEDTDEIWLVPTHFNNKKIPKQNFILVKIDRSFQRSTNDLTYFFNIYGHINITFNTYLLFKFNTDTTNTNLTIPIPKLFSILHHKDNTSINYSLNQNFYQLPMIFRIITGPSLPLYIFYNINMSENASIKLNNNTVNKIFPISSSQFYKSLTTDIPIMFDYKNLKNQNYISKPDLVNKLIEKFDEVFINNSLYGNIIKLLEKSNKLYKNLINDSIELLKKLGKSIEHVIDTSQIINEINLLNFNNRDFDIYSVLAPKYYNTSSMSIGMNTINISNEWFIFKQIKDIYKPSNKISSNLSNYLKNVSNTILEHIKHITDNNEIIEIYNRNQFQEKYDYYHILLNSIQNNYLNIDKYTIETLYDMYNNYSSENTKIYFKNMLIDISSNNIVTDNNNNLFEITDDNSLLTEKFIENKDNYSNEKFNYLGAVEFKNGNFNFNNNITNTQYILTDDLEIIDLSNVNMINLKTYYNSYQININENYINGNFTTTKYIYELEIPSYSVTTLLNKGILISGNYYNFFKNNNYILIGEKELVLTSYAIIGDSSGSMSSFIPTSTIDILNIKIVNNFKSNIDISGNHTNKLIKINTSEYKLIDCISNGIKTYYSIESTTNIQLYDFSKNQLPPFNIINNKISYNNDNKDFIIENFNNDYWYKLDTSIIQGVNLKNLNISGNYNLYLYPNKFLKLVEIFDTSFNNVYGRILNGRLILTNSDIIPNYSYISINNYVYFIKDVSSNYLLDDYLVVTINTPTKVYLLDNSHFKKYPSQYISIIDTSSNETILPILPNTLSDNNLNNLYNLVPSYSYDFKYKQESELDLYVNFSSTQYNFIRPINFTSNTSIFRVKLSLSIRDSSSNYGNFLCYKQSDLSNTNNLIFGKITDISNNPITGLHSIDNNFNISNISRTDFTLTSKEGLQKYKLFNSNKQFTYIWTLLLDDNNYTKFDIQFSNKILDPIIINSNSTLIVDLSNYTVNTNNLLDISNNKLYFNNYFTNITRKQMYYSSFIIGEYKLEKLENNYNNSDIIYCNLDELGIIQETDINGNELSIENFDIYKYIILLDTNSNYKYYNVLSFDTLLNKIIVDGEIEKKLYNAYGFKRNLIFTKNKSSIWKSLTNYYLNTNKNCLFIDDIIMFNNNIFKVIGLNSFKNLYEIELIRKYNDLKLFSDGYYLLYSKNIVPNIPKFEPIVEFTIDDTNNNYRFRIWENDFLQMQDPQEQDKNKFCIKEGNDIILYYKNGKLYNPFNYFLNNNDFIFTSTQLPKFQISFIFNDVINLQTTISYNEEGYYTFHYPYQPCTMENLIFDNNGILLNYYKKNINYYFEYKNRFYKEIEEIQDYEPNTISNSALYTRVIKIPKNQFYFENNKNNYIPGKLVEKNKILIILENENLSNDSFFYNQPIRINNTIKLIKLKDKFNNLIVTNDFISQELDLETNDVDNLKLYLGKKNIQNIYSNYLLDKVNYLKPKINIGRFDYYYILNENTTNEEIIYKSLNYLDLSNNSKKYMNLRSPPLNPHTLIFEDNVLLRDSSFNFLNYNNSYHILLEKIETNQYVSHLCQIKFQNKLKIFTPIENYKSKFYLDKIYPIKINIDNTFEYLDLIIYKQTILNKKPSNEIEIKKKFNISVNGIVELLNSDFKVEVNIGDLSNYINNSEIYTNNDTLCKINKINSLYYLITSNYPENIEYLYIKEINYIKKLKKENFDYIYEKFNESRTFKLLEKNPTNESIKLPLELEIDYNINQWSKITSPDYNLTSYINNLPPLPFTRLDNALVKNITDNEMNNDNYSVDNLNNIITIEEKKDVFNNMLQEDEKYIYIIRSKYQLFNNETYIYFNNITTNIFDESTLQCDIENIFEILFFETDFHYSILFNKLKPWNSWSILTNNELENSKYLIRGPLIYDLSGLRTHVPNEVVYFTNNEFSDLSQSLSSKNFSIDKYNKIKYYQEKIYSYLNSFFKYYEFWKDPKTYINNFAIDISSQIIFDGLHLKLNGKEIIDKIIINNQFDISYNTTHTIYYITRSKSKIENEIYNFINNIKNDELYGVTILDVLKELVKISNNLTNIKDIIKNSSFETKNFTDLLLNVLENELYSKSSNLDIDLTKLKKSFVVENFQLNDNDNDIKNNIITFDTSYNFVNNILEYPTDTFKIMNMVNIPYNINYSIDTNDGLYLYKITLLDEKYKSYIIYKLDFLSGINTLIEPITINNPLVFNNQINFYYKENFDINIDYVISSFKTYDVSSEFLGYLYQVDISSINFNDFTTIKYKETELTAYDNYLVSLKYLESFSSYIQAETPIGIDKYEYDISNTKTKISLIKLNISINITSSQYSVYYNDDSKYYKIIDIDISKNIITIDSLINKFTNPKIVITIKSPTSYTFNNTKLYRLTLDEQLISYADYINFKNVPNNFLINDKIKVIDMKFITDSIVDVIINSSLSNTYKINNLVHYAKIGEYPPEPIKVLDRTNQYLYTFNKFVPFNDISSCFIVYDISYNKNSNSIEYIDNFIRNIGSANYNLSTNVIQDLSGIKFITTRYLTNEQMQYNVFGGVINTFNISNYIYNSSNKTITFTIPQKLILDLDYYYILNNTYLAISNISINQNNLIINWIGGVISGIIVFKQVIIEKEIIKPILNQIYNIELFNNFDLNTNGYLQVLNNEGNEVGQFIYKINTSINDLLNTYDVLINNSNMLKGTILYKNPLYIITNELIGHIYSLTIVDTSITLTDISAVLIQNTYIPYEIYKSNGLKNYSLLINNNIFNIDKLNFLSTDKNKFSIIGRYGKFKLEKMYQNQKIEPTPELVFNLQKKISYVKQNQIETVKFNSDIYKNIFENIDFCIGEQIIERLDKTTFEIQYQFLKDPQKKNQIEKVTKIYDYEGKMRLVIPLEFWFNNQANMYLPLISLPYTDVSIKFKLNKLNQILDSNYTIISEPEINIQVNIDGIILDTFERDMFGNNKHEYLIERFMQYPDNLIDKTSSVIKMIFKNPIKDIYYKTEVSGSSDTCYYTTKIIIDDWQKEYKNKRALYNEFITTRIYTNNNSNSKEFEIIRIAINENISQNSDRYNLFNNSKILRNYDMEMTIYLDEKYQKNLKLERRKYNLELYYTKIYNYKEIKTPIPIIDSMVIKANGKDLFKEINHTYFNKIIPYQKYLNSVDIGYYVYSFSLNPLDNQPSGHLNFSLFDDIVLKSENNNQVVTKPVILKTIVKEYNLLRIMSGLSSLAWID
jgi:hypothetical protein